MQLLQILKKLLCAVTLVISTMQEQKYNCFETVAFAKFNLAAFLQLHLVLQPLPMHLTLS